MVCHIGATMLRSHDLYLFYLGDPPIIKYFRSQNKWIVNYSNSLSNIIAENIASHCILTDINKHIIGCTFKRKYRHVQLFIFEIVFRIGIALELAKLPLVEESAFSWFKKWLSRRAGRETATLSTLCSPSTR